MTDFDDVYRELRTLLTEHTVRCDTLVPTLMSCIRLVERVSQDKGPLKQQLAMSLVSRLIDDSPLTYDEKEIIHTLVTDLGPTIITGLIDAHRGKLFGRKLFPCCQ